MELQIPYSILLTFFCFLIVLLNIIKPNKTSKKLPPGPWKLPLIGNLHQFVKTGSHPHHILRDLAKKHGPLMHLQLGETSNFIVSSAEIVKEINKTHDAIFANRSPQIATDILSYDRANLIFSQYGSFWRHLRKICTLELLTAKRVQSFRFIREEEVSALIKNIECESLSEGSVVNLSEKIVSITNNVISRAAFGKKTKEQEAFLSCLEEVVRLCEGFSVADLFPSITMLQLISGMTTRLKRTHSELDRILENIIRDHRERNVKIDDEDQDLVDVLLNIQQLNNLESALTDENIKAVIQDMFFAGTETSSTTAVWAMSELTKNPKTMEKAQAEVRRVYAGKGVVDETELHQLKYLNAVVKETLRLHPPAPLLVPRENSENCVINGYEIPAKSKVIVNFWSISRDPKYWTEAEIFKPERFLNSSIDYKGTNFEYIPFGAGRRVCPGITFAIPMVSLPLANLLYHFDWKLPNGMKHEELDMTEAFGLSVGKKTDLCLIPIPYHT